VKPIQISQQRRKPFRKKTTGKAGKDVARIAGSILVVLIPALISLYQADFNQ
jgi:hypothetical protein